jgi:hypothetical protein
VSSTTQIIQNEKVVARHVQTIIESAIYDNDDHLDDVVVVNNSGTFEGSLQSFVYYIKWIIGFFPH